MANIRVDASQTGIDETILSENENSVASGAVSSVPDTAEEQNEDRTWNDEYHTAPTPEVTTIIIMSPVLSSFMKCMTEKKSMLEVDAGQNQDNGDCNEREPIIKFIDRAFRQKIDVQSFQKDSMMERAKTS